MIAAAALGPRLPYARRKRINVGGCVVVLVNETRLRQPANTLKLARYRVEYRRRRRRGILWVQRHYEETMRILASQLVHGRGDRRLAVGHREFDTVSARSVALEPRSQLVRELARIQHQR